MECKLCHGRMVIVDDLRRRMRLAEDCIDSAIRIIEKLTPKSEFLEELRSWAYLIKRK
jgi:hypothetical protein